MKYLIITLLVFSLEIGCRNSNSSNAITTPDSLQIKLHIQRKNLPLDVTIEYVVQHGNSYYCLTSNNKFICLKSDFSFDSLLTKLISSDLKFSVAYERNDTLFAMVAQSNKKSYWCYLSKQNTWKIIRSHAFPAFYEDLNYVITECCAGEFGGSVYFKEKSTNRIFSCPATCLVDVTKLNKSFIITTSLFHMSGRSMVFQIDNPSEMYQIDSIQKNSCNWWVQFFPEMISLDTLKKFQIGTKMLLDTSEVIIGRLFALNNQLVFIGSDHLKTYLGYIEDGHIKVINILFNERSYTNRRRICSEQSITPYKTDNASGFFNVSSDTISIVEFSQRKH